MQFDFKKTSNTTLAMFTLITELIQSIITKYYVPAQFLDLKKAFDTLDVDILKQKLDRYGIRNHAYYLIKSYLYQRYQYRLQDNSPRDNSLKKIKFKKTKPNYTNLT